MRCVNEAQLGSRLSPVLLGSSTSCIGVLEFIIPCQDFRRNVGTKAQMALEEVDGGIVNAGDKGGINNSVLAGTGNIYFIDLSLHALRRAVGAPDANLVHRDGAALPHARGGNISWSGYKHFNTVLADEAMKGREPFIVVWAGERKVVGCVGIQLLGRRVEGRKVGNSRLEVDWRSPSTTLSTLLVVSHRKTLLRKQIEALDGARHLHLKR
jgi:hypothetical protein